MSQATATAVAAKVESLGEADLLPFHELLDAEMVNEALKAEKVSLQSLHLLPDRDPLPVPFAGDRPRSFVPRLGGSVDRLACVPGTAPVRRGHRHLL